MPTDRSDQDFENDFAQVLNRVGSEYTTREHALVDSAWGRGRRLRRRRAAGLAAGVTAVVLAGTTAGALAIGSDRPVAGRAMGPASSASATVLTGQQFLGMLTELLPAGRMTVDEARGSESDTPQLRVVVDEGGGAAQLLFWVMESTPGSSARGCEGIPAGDACTATELADGSSLVIYQAGTRDNEPAGSKAWSATLRKSGRTIMLQEWNREPLARDTPVTRVDPPLSPARLGEIVTDPRWDTVSLASSGPAAALHRSG
ncbi:hypothetical protein F4556_005848 [Kitasatospora gansuensis]|uniref:Uncharacterized protein n=1 Tax=Kitasatospora gansuensis TaxID=258050 RepID=A0A7W7SH04_9ACTN|nr:hypothetical protein [Kitasatospora gansuensis]MBB4950313.1 hypothetical protein [Kitasatospora gansuensis]